MRMCLWLASGCSLAPAAWRAHSCVVSNTREREIITHLCGYTFIISCLVLSESSDEFVNGCTGNL